MTVHELFTAEHAQLRRQITELQNALEKTPEKVEALFPLLQANVVAHFHKEDAVYYPTIDADKKMADRELMHTLRNDHAAVIFALESLAIRLRKKVPWKEWALKWDIMVKVLLPHFDHEEKTLFPDVERRLSPLEYKTLSDNVQAGS